MQVISFDELEQVTGGAGDEPLPACRPTAQMAPSRIGEFASTTRPTAQAKEGSIFPPWWQWPTAH